MNYVCEYCGSTRFHYNPSRMKMVCSCCMTPVHDASLDQQLMQYDQTYARARDHLTAGNWQEVINTISPLTYQYPTDKKLYVALLRAATKDYSDINMEDENRRMEASNAWDKLRRMNGLNSEMRRYSRRRYEKHRDEMLHKRNTVLAWFSGGGIGILTAGILFSSRHYFFFVLPLIGAGFCLYRFILGKPYQIFKQLLSLVPNYDNNPFI